MKNPSMHGQAHLFVAAIRILEHQNKKTPALDEICAMLSISPERGHFIARKLTDMEIVKKISGGYENRFVIDRHLNIEEIPRDDPLDDMDKEIKKFMDTRRGRPKEMEKIRMESEKKKKELFKGIGARLKKDIKKNLNPGALR
jgi:hypothetical protein